MTPAVVFGKEWRVAWRSGRMWPLLAMWLMLSALAAAGSIAAQQRAAHERGAAIERDRHTWEAQGERNPHSAAHFGQYAYKPATALGALEPGLDPWLGASVWMEAHYQDPASQRVAEDLTPLSRMGMLSLGWMLQVLLPLTILVLGFDLFAGERARGGLKLQLAAGARPPDLMLGKAAALVAATLLVTLPAWIAALVVTRAIESAAFSDQGARLALWLGAYGAYALVWVLLTLAVSAFASQARTSLGVLSGLWLLCVLLLPRLAAEQAEQAYPTPQASAFWARIHQGQQEGLEGDESRDVRLKRLEAQTLARYGVDRVEDLPVGWAGLVQQSNEDYGNQVFDRYYAQLWAGYRGQAARQQQWAWIAPAIAPRDLAMAAAGTDVIHHEHFVRAAERHRRALQRFLNGETIAHGRGTASEFRAAPDFWTGAPRFSYRMPLLAPPWPCVAVLVLWLVLGLAGCVLGLRRLNGAGVA